jgi:hypothetical protein
MSRPITELPTQQYLRECLSYDPETGELHWNERPVAHFVSVHARTRWNGRYAGKPAFRKPKDGYFSGHILKRDYRAHRVIWKWMTGEEPATIDHINGQRGDNRWANLRSIPGADNQLNVKLYRCNKSGRCGVQFHKAARKWMASISARGQQHYLGLYDTFEAAVAAREEAEKRLGFHPNHGKTSAERAAMLEVVR